MKIRIVIPYAGAAMQTARWAKAENRIDFRAAPEDATRCTLAYAAVELREHLGRAMPDAQIEFGDSLAQGAQTVELTVKDSSSRSDVFTFEPIENGVRVRGEGRTGALYGAYELLHRQGWRWFAPGEPGLLTGEHTDSLWPAKKETVRPSFGLSRGVNRICQDSADLLIWMARNRLNTAAYRPDTAPVARKLGMFFKDGGHQWEEILHPDYPAPEGGTLWEKHIDWFGLPADGKKVKEKARNNQFCMTNDGVLEYLAEDTIRGLCDEMHETDILDVWFHDAWGGMCYCDKCRELGSDTDRALHFLAGLRGCLSKAESEGRLNRHVVLSMAAYEGCCTMDPPTRPIPKVLSDAGDRILFFPIHKCYRHDFDDPGCSVNAAYHAQLEGWLKAENALPIIIGEYYNVSRFVDLPLVFTQRISRDLPALCNEGVSGMSYMHVPLEAWGPRALNNLLYSRFSWDTGSSVSDLLGDYKRRFGKWGDAMLEIHELLESAFVDIADWRCWAERAVLRELHTAWDGTCPFEPLNLSAGHFGSEQNALNEGRRTLKDIARARELTEQALVEAQDAWAAEGHLAGQPVFMTDITSTADPLAPRIVVREQLHLGGVLQLIEEMLRLVVYGQDVMSMMVDMLEYRDALSKEDRARAEETWQRLELVERRLVEHWSPPAGWLRPRPVASAYHQSLMRKMMARCRRWRQECCT